ncbi:MAG: lipopolysaccharide kinase InaA family protein [Candidatus Micrarchaeota archaeon]
MINRKKSGIRSVWTAAIKDKIKPTRIIPEKIRRNASYAGDEIIYPAQFVVQPLKSVQKMKYTEMDGQRVRYEKGKTLKQAAKENPEWVHKNRHAIVRQITDAIVDMNLRFGMLHGDMHEENIIVEKTKAGKPKIKVIDFDDARELKPFGSETHSIEEEYFGITKDFRYVDDILSSYNLLCRTKEESKELKKYLRDHYEKRVNEIFKTDKKRSFKIRIDEKK